MKRTNSLVFSFAIIFAAALISFNGCSSSGDNNNNTGDNDIDSVDGADNAENVEYATIKTVVPTTEYAPVRNFVIKRALIHHHSPYSHDGCDEKPRLEDGSRNEECFEDLRASICGNKIDYLFLTDHAAIFADYEYPEVLLYKEGDTLIMRNEEPVANTVNCPDGHKTIVAAGTETGMMPIGIEHHIGKTPAERRAFYGLATVDAANQLKEAGAKVFVFHTEEWELSKLIELPLDGIEIYNTHYNLMSNMMAAAGLILKLDAHPEEVLEFELALMAVFQENAKDMEHWANILKVKPMVGILATDAHQNAFPGKTPDGDRLDSFRRLDHWFSNHLLLQKDAVMDDKTAKDAIGKGRLYGAFEYLGYPMGFDYRAELDGKTYEMGETVTVAGTYPTLTVKLPSVYMLDPNEPAPLFKTMILKAGDGVWTTVKEGTGDISFTPTEKGVYRSVVMIRPLHLTKHLGTIPESFLNAKDGTGKYWPWIYSNVIYVGVDYAAK